MNVSTGLHHIIGRRKESKDMSKQVKYTWTPGNGRCASRSGICRNGAQDGDTLCATCRGVHDEFARRVASRR